MQPVPKFECSVVNCNDSQANRYFSSRILTRAGFRVIEAGCGLQALELVAELRPEVLLLDVRLPDIDGFEVCRRIRRDEALAAVGVILTSASFVSSEEKAQGIDLGADAYLPQPFEALELIALVRAVGRLKTAERELRLRAERLAEADQHKNEFLAMLAHELRNPLSAVAGALAMLEIKPPGDDRERRARAVLGRQTRHLARLVDDLLDVSRVTRGKIQLQRERIELAGLLEQVGATARERWFNKRSQKLTVELPATPAAVFGDPTRLEQVVTNLLDNASKYSQSGQAIHMRLTSAAGCAVIEVVDEGMGLSPEVLGQVFTLFFQTDQALGRSQGGLGIGLTLVQTLIEQHGGTVSAASGGLGKGTTLRIELPLDTSLKVLAAKIAEPKALPLRGDCLRERRRVLLVDDQDDVREMLRELIEQWGHTVISAAGGPEAIAHALTGAIDLALIDLGMPGMDGFETARRIRADPRGLAIPLVALTGYGSENHRGRALESGFDMHLVKPVSLDELELLIRSPPVVHARGGVPDIGRPSAA